MRDLERLPVNEVHVWLARPETAPDPGYLARLRNLLSKDERDRHSRFVFERDRHLYLVAHALVRCTLAGYLGLDPAGLRFEHNRYGRPRLASEQAGSGLSFNLTHTRDLVACAVTVNREIGVDVEAIERSVETASIAGQFFAAAEVAELRAAPAAQQRELFFSYWTLKESYIKARGMGLSLPLKKFSFDVQNPEQIGITFDPGLRDDAGRWQFGLFRPTREHVMALSVRRCKGERLAVKIRNAVPAPAGLEVSVRAD